MQVSKRNDCEEWERGDSAKAQTHWSCWSAESHESPKGSVPRCVHSPQGRHRGGGGREWKQSTCSDEGHGDHEWRVCEQQTKSFRDNFQRARHTQPMRALRLIPRIDWYFSLASASNPTPFCPSSFLHTPRLTNPPPGLDACYYSKAAPGIRHGRCPRFRPSSSRCRFLPRAPELCGHGIQLGGSDKPPGALCDVDAGLFSPGHANFVTSGSIPGRYDGGAENGQTTPGVGVERLRYERIDEGWVGSSAFVIRSRVGEFSSRCWVIVASSFI